MSERTNHISLRDYILQTEKDFDQADLYYGHGTSEPLDEAAWLVGSALGIESEALDDSLETVLSDTEVAMLDRLVTERIEHTNPSLIF